MGNEQSAASSSAHPSTSFSFLNRGSTTRRQGGIVKVSDGQSKQPDPADDADYRRLKEIPRFLPILRNSIAAGRHAPPPETSQNLSPRPIWRLSVRVQSHLHDEAKHVSQAQSKIVHAIGRVDQSSAALAAKLLERKRKYDRLRASLADVAKLQDDVVRIQLLLEEIVPCVQSLNELLAPAKRLPPLDLQKLLTDECHAEPEVALDASLIAAIQETRVRDQL